MDPEPAKKFTDLMIDIEGCSDLPDAAPHEIGLTFFNLAEPIWQQEPVNIAYHPSAISSIVLGMSVTTSTLKWWAEKLTKPLNLSAGDPIQDILFNIIADFKEHAMPDARVWSRGNAYDLSSIRLLLHRCNLEIPWQYWRERDVRSFLDALGKETRREQTHIASEDAFNQATSLSDAKHGAPPKADATTSP